MFGSIYNGYSGLLAYSSGLDSISNNVANMNTAGYKGEDPLFEDVVSKRDGFGNGFGREFTGTGVCVGGSRSDLRQGEIRETGNETDLAVDGKGFFVIKEEDEIFYTRNGQFSYDESGRLVANGTSACVCGMNDGGELVEVSVDGLRVDPPQATSQVRLSGNIRPTEIYYEVDDVEMFDSAGTIHVCTIVFHNPESIDGSTKWNIEIRSDGDEVVASGLEVWLDETGLPLGGRNTCEFLTEFAGAEPATVSLSIGEPGTVSGVRSRTTEASAIVSDSDGCALGSLRETGFKSDGTFFITYSNGETREFMRLVLADIEGMDSVSRAGSGRYQAKDSDDVRLSVAGKEGMGDIRDKAIELSNVDLAEEFTEMIIIQRGYQSSSQVLTAANEMIQQLLDGLRAK